jgi:hypothetical protein
LVETWCRTGTADLPATSTASLQSKDEILRDVERRVSTLNSVADGIYARWAQRLRS